MDEPVVWSERQEETLQFAANEAGIFSADGLGNPGILYVLSPLGGVSISARMLPLPSLP